MRLLGSIVVALLLAAPASAAAEQVLYVGDSLGVGTTPGLARELGSSARVHGDSRIGRPSPEGVQVLQRMISGADDAVVFDLGTNDDPARPEVLARDLAAARRIAGERCLVVATLNRPPLNGVPVDRLNEVVLAFASSEPNVQLVDWNAIATSEPGLLASDRIHATPQGYAVRAQLFAEAVTSCGSDAALGDPEELVSPDPRPQPETKRKRRPPPKVPGIESSGISFSEPVSFRGLTAQLRLPNTKPPYPAVAMPGGTQVAAEFLAARGIATLTYRARPGARDTGAAVQLLDRRKDVRAGGVGILAAGSAADAIASVRAQAIVAISPSPLPDAVVRDWRIRNDLGADAAPVTKWLRLTGDGERPDRWRSTSAALLAVWGSRDDSIPVRASAQALRHALEQGPNRDRTFRWFDAGHVPYATPGVLEEIARWLGLRLGAKKAKPVVSTPLPPPNGGRDPVGDLSAGGLLSPPVQIGWLVFPLLLLAAGLMGRRVGVPATPPVPLKLIAVGGGLALASLAAIAADIALALDSHGGAQAAWLAAIVLGLAALAAAALLASRRAYLPVLAVATWVGLAAYWLL